MYIASENCTCEQEPGLLQRGALSGHHDMPWGDGIGLVPLGLLGGSWQAVDMIWFWGKWWTCFITCHKSVGKISALLLMKFIFHWWVGAVGKRSWTWWPANSVKELKYLDKKWSKLQWTWTLADSLWKTHFYHYLPHETGTVFHWWVGYLPVQNRLKVFLRQLFWRGGQNSHFWTVQITDQNWRETVEWMVTSFHCRQSNWDNKTLSWCLKSLSHHSTMVSHLINTLEFLVRKRQRSGQKQWHLWALGCWGGMSLGHLSKNSLKGESSIGIPLYLSVSSSDFPLMGSFDNGAVQRRKPRKQAHHGGKSLT